mmetsp:Transcript_5837/g.16569  ORF Transcript_5837/g.16569 Transcript_5837/m.16569 type:complete len:491 (-) Transcript_5837:1494-2966(-)
MVILLARLVVGGDRGARLVGVLAGRREECRRRRVGRRVGSSSRTHQGLALALAPPALALLVHQAPRPLSGPLRHHHRHHAGHDGLLPARPRHDVDLRDVAVAIDVSLVVRRDTVVVRGRMHRVRGHDESGAAFAAGEEALELLLADVEVAHLLAHLLLLLLSCGGLGKGTDDLGRHHQQTHRLQLYQTFLDEVGDGVSIFAGRSAPAVHPALHHPHRHPAHPLHRRHRPLLAEVPVARLPRQPLPVGRPRLWARWKGHHAGGLDLPLAAQHADRIVGVQARCATGAAGRRRVELEGIALDHHVWGVLGDGGRVSDRGRSVCTGAGLLRGGCCQSGRQMLLLGLSSQLLPASSQTLSPFLEFLLLYPQLLQLRLGGLELLVAPRVLGGREVKCPQVAGIGQRLADLHQPIATLQLLLCRRRRRLLLLLVVHPTRPIALLVRVEQQPHPAHRRFTALLLHAVPGRSSRSAKCREGSRERYRRLDGWWCGGGA